MAQPSSDEDGFSPILEQLRRPYEVHIIKAILGFGLLFSLFSFFFAHTELNERLKMEFEWVARSRINALATTLDRGLSALTQSTQHRALHAGSLDDTALTILHRQLSTHLPGVEALLWVPERVATEAQISWRLADERQRPLSEARLLTAWRSVLGNPGTGPHPVVSDRLPLGNKQETRAYGVLAAVSVHAPRSVQGGEGSENRLLGDIAAVIHIPTLVARAMATVPPRGVACRIQDPQRPEEESTLTLHAHHRWDQPTAYTLEQRIVVADRHWSITCAPTRHYRSAIEFQEGPWLLLVGGLFLTVLFAVYSFKLRREVWLRERMAVQLQASRNQLHILFDQSPDIIMSVRQDGSVTLINRQPAAHGDPGAPITNARTLFPPEERGWFEQALNQLFANRCGRPGSKRFMDRDGRCWEVRLVPLQVDDENPEAMVIATDITEQHSLEVQAISNARLASLGILAANIAHEINNPTSVIRFNTAILKRSWSDLERVLCSYQQSHGSFAIGGLEVDEALESLPKVLDGMDKNCQRIRTIVNNLKHLARPDPGNMNEMVELRHLLETVVGLLRNKIKKYSDHFIVELPETMNPVIGNAQQLEQVFINVILNALQSLPDRNGSVTLTADVLPAGGMRIEVIDEGSGIEEGQLESIFDPFFSTKGEQGMGLGLSICHRIIHNHKGSLKITNRRAGGVRATILLPPAPAT
ncbi:MAG: PAS domain-containing protein [Magnetococcales bacterium]|nr:PAS domain-containing protein [Magnetococcales bacterium]